MTASDQRPIAIFPDMPRETPMVKEGGFMSDEWQLYFDQLTVALQTYFKPEGIVVPPLTSSQIALLTGAASDGNIIYNTTIPALQGNINGTWKTFLS